jgi:transposase-like protein
MITLAPSNLYKHHRFPGEIISHGVWLYYCFSLSHRDAEELLFACDRITSYEAIRTWCRKFGQAYANALCRRRPHPGDKWHLNEVFITINARRTYSNVHGQENIEVILAYMLRSDDITITRCLGAS